MNVLLPSSNARLLQSASSCKASKLAPGNTGLQPASGTPFVEEASTADAGLRGAAPQSNHTLHQLIQNVAKALARRGEALAVGETSAGGELNLLLNSAVTSGKWFRGGMVVYAGSDLPFLRSIQDVASDYGVVSEEYVTALAQYVRRTFACQWVLTESGIAGPQTGRRSAKPAGMVCLAVAGPDVAGTHAQERGTSPRATADMLEGVGQVWAATRILADRGRTANQRQFAIESLRLFHQVLRTLGED